MLAADADLTLTASAPASAVMGETIPVSWIVQNVGTGIAERDWLDQVYLSSDDQFDPQEDMRLVSRNVQFETPLAPGAEYTARRNLAIPSTTPGEQFLLFVVDTAGRQEELNELNNVLALPISLAAPDVDLGITPESLPTEVLAGVDLTFHWTVHNSGAESTTATNWRDSIYLSADTTLDQEDQHLASVINRQFLPLGPGDSFANQAVAFNVRPETVGDYYFIFSTDHTDLQGELNETNNQVAVPVAFLAPNVTVSDPVAPASAEAGEIVSVAFTVTNTGSHSTFSYEEDAVYFSSDASLDSADRRLALIDVEGNHPLVPGLGYSASEQFVLPNDIAGDGYLLFVADAFEEQLETDRTDNIAALPFSIAAPDLQVIDLEAPASAIAGDTIDVNWTVFNSGPGSAQAGWEDGIFISADNVLDEQDTLLETRSAHRFQPLTSGSDYTDAWQVQLDRLAPGDYHLFIETDYRNRQPEADDSNNFRSIPITLTAPNLTPTSFEVPEVAAVNETITASWTVRNNSENAANAFWYDAIYLSSDSQFDEGDLLLSTLGGQSPLDGETSYTQSRDVEIRGEVGEQFLLLIVDAGTNGTQGETDESDNLIARPITITPSPANLAATDFAAPTQAASGEKIDITWTVTNDASEAATGSWYDEIYLSADPKFDTFDQRLLQQNQGDQSPLAAGASYTNTTSVSLFGASGGLNYLLLITDTFDGVAESDETDNLLAIPIEIGLPNLTVTELSAPVVAPSGAEISVSWTTHNDSPHPATGSWNDAVYLSRDALLDEGDRVLSSINTGSLTPLAPGASYSTGTGNVRLSNVAAGDYFLIVAANYNHRQGEADDYDNVFASPITVVLPDVQPTDLSAPASAVLGQPINVTWTVQNISDVVASGGNSSWRDEIYLSDDDVLDRAEDRRILAHFANSVTPIAAGESYTQSRPIYLPGSETGSKFLILVIDAVNSQYESDESNNLLAIPIQLNAPDLVVSEANAPESALAGEQITLSWTVTNQGDYSAQGDWRDYVYLSSDDVWDAGDRQLFNQSTSSLDAGASYSRTRSATLSQVAAGSQYLLFFTDRGGGQGETNETNNVRAVPITINAPDLVVESASLPSSIINLGEAVDLTWTVQNIGAFDAIANWNDRIYLSRDSELDPSDANLGLLPASEQLPLESGASYTKTQTIVVTADGNIRSGDMYLLVKADGSGTSGSQTETNESNNVYAIPIELRVPDLIVTELTAPDVLKPGQDAEISWTVKNVGDGVATNNWFDFLAISEDKQLSCPGECGEFDIELVSSSEFLPLGPGESYTQTQLLTIPQRAVFGGLIQPGRYFLGVKADERFGSDQAESNENNNSLFIPVEVVAPDVDLVITELSVPSQAELGDSIEITVTVTNQGTEPATGNSGRWTDLIRLSDDPSSPTGDTLLQRSSRDDLPLGPGESYTFTEQVTIDSDLDGGSRFIVVQTDTGSQLESDETNNTAFAPIEIAAPNLRVTAVTAPTVAALSETIQVSWTVENAGDVPALADWRDRVYLSNDQVVNSGDRSLLEANVAHVSPLAPGESYTVTQNVILSNVTAGAKYLLFYVDNRRTQGETDEIDNVYAVPIDLASADLALTGIEGPAEASVGETLSITRTVANQGVGAAPANWSDAVYLSTDTSLDINDPRIGLASASEYRPLAVGASYTAPIQVAIPNVAPGDYFFLIKTDVFSSQTEISEENNFEHIPVSIAAPDLSLTDASGPSAAVSNAEISVSYTVTNISDTVAAADWQDRIYLSTDETLAGVIGAPLHTETIQGQSPLAAGASYEVSVNVTLPGVESGDYFLLFETNSNGAQGETERSNNLRTVPLSIEVPNLTVAQATAPSNGFVNEVIDVSYRVLNDSTFDAFGNWNDQIWLSTDLTFDPSSDRLLRTVPIEEQTPLLAGADYTLETTVTLPKDSSGEQFLLFVSNTNALQGEATREDNVRAEAISIAPPPNLVVTDLQVPDVAAVFEPITVTYTVTNTGSTPAMGTWSDLLGLYDNNNLGSGGQFLDLLPITEQSPLEPGASYTIETTVTMPSASGDRFLMVRTNESEMQGETNYNDNHVFSPISIVAPDLAISNAQSPAEGALGESITISYMVTNLSGVPAVRHWSDQVFLSNDQVLDNNDLEILSERIEAPTTLNGGESYLVTRDIVLPRFATGNQFLILVTDDNDLQPETDEENNVSEAVPILLQASDLSVSDVLVPSEAISGQAFNVTWTVTNTGDAPVSNWTDRILASVDDRVGGDLILGDFPFHGTLSPGESVTRTQGALPPISLSGPRYVVVTSDASDLKPELDESNNSKVSDETVSVRLAPIPNLRPSEVTASATERQLFEAFEVQWIVTNAGTGATDTPFWRDEVYLSVDQQLDSTDVRIGTVLNPNFLNEGEAYSNSATVRARGVSEGDYYLLVRTDGRNNVEEYFNEGDNIAVGPRIRITLPPPPDLVVSNVIAPEIAFSGQPMLINWTVENQGDASAFSRWDDAVYMSEDEILDANDRLLSTIPHQTLYQVYQTVSYTGDYESCFEEPAPDVETSLYFENPDFDAANNLYLSLLSQENVHAVCSFTNNTTGLLETVERHTDYDFEIAENALSVGETYTRSVSVRLPVGVSGDYFFFVMTDVNNRVNEFAFDNNNENLDSTATMVNLTPPPDLVITDIQPPEVAQAGHPFTFSYAAINAGSTRTPNFQWYDSFYLSTDRQLDPAEDIRIADGPINLPGNTALGLDGGLDVDEIYSRDVTLTMPNGLEGDYYLIAVADRTDLVFEADNSNNALASASPLSVSLLPPDLAITSVLAESTAKAGESLAVAWTVANQGEGQTIATAWTDSLYASFDAQVGGDILLGNFTHYGVVNAGESYERIGNVAIPQNLGGEVYLYVRTDARGDVAEFSGEANNLSDFIPVNVIRETADLRVTATDFEVENGRVRLAWQVENVGSHRPDSGYWRDAVYLSQNETVGDDDDVLLQSIHIAPAQSLVPGNSYSVDRVFDIPFELNDDYHFFVLTDDDQHVDESGMEANNQAQLGQLDTSTLRVFPDLVVHAVDAPNEAISGQFFDVTWTVRNIGDALQMEASPPEYSQGNWIDSVYLSRDQVFDAASDYYLGGATINKSSLNDVVEGNFTFQEYSLSRSFRVPDGVTGPLYVIVLTDRRNQVIETGAEENNRALDGESVFVSLAEVADLAIGVVNVPADTAVGSNIALSYTIENLGENRVAGRWWDRLYLSTDDQFSLDDVSLGLNFHSFNVIDPGASDSYDFSRLLPPVLPGDYHVILRTDAFNSFPESDEFNNLGASLDTFNISVPEISVVDGMGSTEIESFLISQQTKSFYYRFTAEEGQTLAIDGIGIDLDEETYIDHLGNEVTGVRRHTSTAAYVSFEGVPTPVNYDYSQNAWYSAERNEYAVNRLVIPRAEAGYYYLRVDVTDHHYASNFSFNEPSREHFRLELNVLPFSILSVGPDVVGNSGSATVEVTASNFNLCSAAELLRDGQVVRMTDDIRLIDESRAYIPIDFDGLSPGTYQLRLTDHDGSIATQEIEVIDGVGSRVDASIGGPRNVRAGEYVFYANYGNNGDSDGIAPLMLITNLDASPFSLTRDGLPIDPEAGTMVQAFGVSPDGAAGVLRPGQRNSVPVFFRVNGPGAVGRFHMHTITAADSRPLNFDLLEQQVRPEAFSDEEWAPIRDGLQVRIGSTWGSYVRALAEVSTYLADIGVRTSNVDVLFDELVRQAAAPENTSLSGHIVAGNACLPVSSPLVRAIGVDGNVVAAQANELGFFRFVELPAGEYTLVVDAKGYAREMTSHLVVEGESQRLSLHLQPESTISGSVQLASESTNAGRIAVSARLLGTAGLASQFSTSTVGGEFSLEGLPAGEYELTVSLIGHQSYQSSVTISAEQVLELEPITLAPAASIAGTVSTSVQGIDLGSLTVGAYSDGQFVLGSAVDSDGQFQISGLAAGTYEVYVSNPLYQHGFAQGISSSETVFLDVGQTANETHLTIFAGGNITGVVSDMSGTPLAAVRVLASTMSGARYFDFTDEEGKYQFTNLGVGEYRVSLPLSSISTTTLVQISDANSQTVTADLTFDSATQLFGKTTDASGNPIVGVRVSLLENGKLILSTRSDDEGNYRFMLVRGGEFELRAEVDGASFPVDSAVTVAEDEHSERNLVAGTASLRVNLTNGANNGQDDMLFLYRIVGGERITVGSAFLDESGATEFGNLVAGDYLVRVVSGVDQVGSVAVTLEADAEKSVDVELTTANTFSIDVVDNNGEGIAAALVILYQDGVSKSLGVTGDAGQFTTSLVESGTYDIVVIVDGFRTQVLESVSIETDVELQATLEPSNAVILGRLVAPDGEPIAHGSIEIHDENGRLVGYGDVSPDGTFRISTAHGTNLTLVARAAGHAELTMEIAQAGTESLDAGSLTMEPVAISQGGDPADAPAIPSGTVAETTVVTVYGPQLPGESANRPFYQDGQLFPQSTSGVYVIDLLTKMVNYTFRDGDFDRFEATEVQASSVLPLPDGCDSCAALRNRALIAQRAQGVHAEIAEIVDETLFHQRRTVVLIFGAEFTALAAGVVGTITAALALAPVIAELAAVVSGVGATVSTAGVVVGTSATAVTGIGAVSGATIVTTLLGIVNTLQSINNKTVAIANAPDTQTAVQNVEQVSGLVGSLLGLLRSGLSWLQTANYTEVSGSVARFAGVASVLTGIKSFYDGIQFTNTANALDLLFELELRMAAAQVHYDNSKINAREKLEVYIQCLGSLSTCDPEDERGNNGNNNNNGNSENDENDPNTPTPPSPPTPPFEFEPTLIVSADPNDIIGPEGFGQEGWIGADLVLPYMIRFENIAEASGPAQRVTIEQQLDNDLDPRTFRVDDFGWNEFRMELRGDQPFFQGRIPLQDESGFVVDVTATVDVVSGMLTWIFQTIDPATGEAPRDALAGFLPPNVPKGVGEGFVTYTVRPRRNSPTGTRVDAEATIVFDTNEPIDTPPIFNTLDAVSSSSQTSELPSTFEEPNFLVSWSGNDDENGSALADYTVYVSVDNGAWQTWLQDTTLTEATYVGEIGRHYAFTTTARDNAGNEEALRAVPDTETTIGTLGSVGDFVWSDDNYNGIQDADEPGIAEVFVYLLDEAGNQLATTTTDSNGRYRFDSLTPSSTYSIEVIPPAGYAFSLLDEGVDDSIDSDIDTATGLSAPFTASIGDNKDWDVGLVKLGSISGVVWNDLDEDALREGDEPRLGNWVVYLDMDNDGVLDADEPTATTAPDGSYRFEGLLPGNYIVAQVMQENWSQTFPGTTGASSVAITTEEQSSGVNTSKAAYTPSAELINLDDLRADPAFGRYTGSSYSVVIIDSGIDVDHPLFGPDQNEDGVADRIVFQYDFADDDTDASDGTGHGSHLASVVAGQGDELVGVAPEVDIIALKVFGDHGRGQFSDVERALQWVLENAGTYNIAAVNLSFGDGNNWDAATSRYGLSDELRALGEMGVITVSAAGNNYGFYESVPGVQYPAADPNVIAVGAVWAEASNRSWSFGTKGTDYTSGPDRIVSFSQRDSELIDTFAPGGLVRGANAFGGMSTMRGTSHAAPFVTGAAVLVQQAAEELLGRRLTLAEFRNLLRASGVTITDGDDEDDNVDHTGLDFSRMDIEALLRSVADVDPVAAQPTPLPAAGENTQRLAALNGLPFVYTIQLAPGQIRDDVDFGVASQLPWHNSAMPADVNGDEFVSSIDALLLINHLNRYGSGELPHPTDNEVPPPFLDVSGDNHVSPIDALLVIHHLNTGLDGEEESLDARPEPSSSWQSHVDDLFLSLSEQTSVDHGAADFFEDLEKRRKV